MLRFMLTLWNNYSYWTFGSLFFIGVLWQFCSRFRKTPNQNCYQCQRKIKRCLKASGQRVWKSSQEDTKIPLELLSILKRSQTGIPMESCINHIRKLLCRDPSCSICNFVALEAKYLLSGKKDLHPPQMLSTSPASSSLEGMTLSTLCFEKRLARSSSEESLLSELSVQTPSTVMGSLSPSVVPKLRDTWTEPIQWKKVDISNPLITCIKATTSRPEKPQNPTTYQDTTIDGDLSKKLNNQKKEIETKKVFLNTEFLQFTRHPITTQTLQKHLEKRTHFRRWGIPKRVEQLRPEPPIHYCTGKEHGSFLPEEVSERSTVEKRSIGPHNMAPWGADQPEEPLKNISPDLPSPSIPLLNFCPLNQGTSGVKTRCLNENSQFFWGLPSLHSEYLVASFLRHNSCSSPTLTNKLSHRDNAIFFNEISPLTWLSHSPPSFLPTSLGSNNKSLEETHIKVPFHYENETLERCRLPKHLQVLCGLPSLMKMPLLSQNPLAYENGEAEKALLPPWSNGNFSVLTKELLFFPDHARKLLELHFQRQLLQRQVEPPESIQESLPLLQSMNNQLQVPKSTSTKVQKRHHQNDNPQLKWAQETVPKMTFVPVINPETYAKAKEITQEHLEKKCVLIKQGIFTDIISDSRHIKKQFSAGDLPTQISFPAVHSNMEPEVPTFLDTNATAQKELGINQQTLSVLGKSIRRLHKTWTLPQSLIEKLEIIVTRKYLAFLSGLPAPYYMALCREMSPLAISQIDMPGKGKGVIKQSIGTKSSRIWNEEPLIIPKAETDYSTMNSGDNKNHLQVLQQIKVSRAELERKCDKETSERIKEQREFDYPQCPHSPRKSVILTKLDCHLRKKVLQINGIPKKVLDSRKLFKALESPLPETYLANVLTVVSTENPKDLQETLSSPGKQELPEMSSSPVNLGAEVPTWTYFKEQFSIELKHSLMRISQNHTESYPIAFPLTSSPVPGLQTSKVTEQYPQRKPTVDMTDSQVLCVNMEAEQRSPGQGNYCNTEPQTPWDHQAKAIGSIPNKGEGSKGDQGKCFTKWKTSFIKWIHSIKPRRRTNSPMSRTDRISHPGNRDHYQTYPLQKLSQSFPKAEHLGAIFGVPGRKKTERDDYEGSQRKLKNTFPPTNDPKHYQSRGTKNSFKMTKRATKAQVSERTESSQSQPSSKKKFSQKIKHFLHWLSLQKKHNNQNLSHTFPWPGVTPTKSIHPSAKGFKSKKNKTSKPE